MFNEFDAKSYALPRTGVEFSSSRPELKRVFDDCERLLKDNIKVYNGRRVLASSSFMSIEPNVMKDCLATDEFRRERARLLAITAGRRAVVSVCYLERLKGLPLQLQAINSLLESAPALASSVVFLLVALKCLSDA